VKVALVHDSIGEFGGAERVLLALSEVWPDAPIYTAFARGGETLKRLTGKRIITSWAQKIPFFATKLHSPLRFLAPFIWGSFDFSKYDLVMSSASWYINKGYGTKNEKRKTKNENRPIEICYCHTPPRWLYGYDIPLGKNRGFLVNSYVSIVAHIMRMYDFERAQKVNYFIANSENVKARIEKFYRREAEVIYPPIEIKALNVGTLGQKRKTLNELNYYLIISRITGGKGIEMAVEVANRLKIPLKIAGASSGYSGTSEWIKENAGPTVQVLGFVDDQEQARLYAGAKAFLALQRDEDFGMTPVEAMGYGTPVIAYNGGGYPESVVDGKTGVLFDDYSVKGLVGAIGKFEGLKIKPEDCRKQAQKFSKERFVREIRTFVGERVLKL